jgi:hypothetical protein
MLRALVVARRDRIAEQGVVITAFGRAFPDRDGFDVHYEGTGAITEGIRAEFAGLPFTINFRHGGSRTLDQCSRRDGSGRNGTDPACRT